MALPYSLVVFLKSVLNFIVHGKLSNILSVQRSWDIIEMLTWTAFVHSNKTAIGYSGNCNVLSSQVLVIRATAPLALHHNIVPIKPASRKQDLTTPVPLPRGHKAFSLYKYHNLIRNLSVRPFSGQLTHCLCYCDHSNWQNFARSLWFTNWCIFVLDNARNRGLLHW